MNAHARNMPEPLPDALEAEQALLGSILHNNEAYWRVAGFLKPQHFSEPLHAKLYDAMAGMITEQRPVTPVTLKSYINPDEVIHPTSGDDGGPLTVFRYVLRLFSEAVTVVNCYEYGRGIMEVWSRRQLITASQDLIQLAQNPPRNMTPDKMVGEMAARLTKIAQEGNERAASQHYGVILPAALEEVAQASLRTDVLIPWFLPEIEQVVGKCRRGNLIGFMSDSGGGKTSLALSQCRHAADAGFKSAFFSIEITEREAALQAAAQAARVPLSRIDEWTLQSREEERLGDEIQRAMNLPFDIVGFADCQLSDIAIKLEAIVKQKGLDFVAIDHAKLINFLARKNEIFAQQVFQLYGGLKGLAKRLNVCIVILIQRNSDWKRRWEKGGNIRSLRPIKGDAYGGENVEQNLDQWFSLYRPEPLLRSLVPAERNDAKREKLEADLENSINRAWIINHKRRRGQPHGSEEIIFEPECTLFRSPQPEMPAAFEGFQ